MTIVTGREQGEPLKQPRSLDVSRTPGLLECEDGVSPDDFSPGRRLLGRARECEALDQLLDGALEARRGGVLVVHGKPGVGKTALLEYAVEAAGQVRIVRTFGVEAEMEIPFAAVQQLCCPFFISSNTVEYHLKKIFRKLDTKSRTQLAQRMA